MTKRFIVTGKDAYYDTLEKCWYVYIHGVKTQVKTIQEMAYWAWTTTSESNRKEFLKRLGDPRYNTLFLMDYQDLPEEVRAKILEYQQDKAKVIPA